MKPLLATMLARAAVCALSTAPALAGGAPNIHIAFASKLPMTIKSVGFAKTNISQVPKGTVSTVTETAGFTGSFIATQFVNSPKLLWAESWYATSSGKCIQPPKQKFENPHVEYLKVKTGTASVENPCSTGVFTECVLSAWIIDVIDHIAPLSPK